MRRLANIDTFIMPSQNPDGRDDNNRTNGLGLRPEPRLGPVTQRENVTQARGTGLKYPPVGLHRRAPAGGNNYFFPPNEDPVHHEISDAASTHQGVSGPPPDALNDQGITYQNYNAYDLFAPVYGDPCRRCARSGRHDLEQGSGGAYAKQVYDHYIIQDETLNITSQKREDLLTDWVLQWDEAVEQGEEGFLEPNQLVSPVHDEDDILPGSDPTGQSSATTTCRTTTRATPRGWSAASRRPASTPTA